MGRYVARQNKLRMVKASPDILLMNLTILWYLLPFVCYLGGGRNIVRVDVTPDGGKSWQTATIMQGSEQRFGRAWAWVFWECEVPAALREDGSVELACKAVDMAFNVQPERCDHMWNVRGLGNNSWYRTHVHPS